MKRSNFWSGPETMFAFDNDLAAALLNKSQPNFQVPLCMSTFRFENYFQNTLYLCRSDKIRRISILPLNICCAFNHESAKPMSFPLFFSPITVTDSDAFVFNTWIEVDRKLNSTFIIQFTEYLRCNYKCISKIFKRERVSATFRSHIIAALTE